jgi:hypothetical protein
VPGYGARLTAHASRATAHGSWIVSRETWATNHGQRITGNESRITNHASRITHHGSRVMQHQDISTDHGQRITDLILNWEANRFGLTCFTWNIATAIPVLFYVLSVYTVRLGWYCHRVSLLKPGYLSINTMVRLGKKSLGVCYSLFVLTKHGK